MGLPIYFCKSVLNREPLGLVKVGGKITMFKLLAGYSSTTESQVMSNHPHGTPESNENLSSRESATRKERAGVSRRRFLRTSAAAGAATAGTLGAAHAYAQSSLANNFSSGTMSSDIGHAVSSAAGSSAQATPVEPVLGELPFLHGVASGDPLPDRVILWTRVTPTQEAMPGSGVGSDTKVNWAIARDGKMQDIVLSGEATATSQHDHTVHVDTWGLEPNHVYYYQFSVAEGEHKGKSSPIGRTKTAPALGESLSQINFAVASCANWESGFFSAYSDMANRAHAGELDCTVFLGDYIYEYETGEYAGLSGVHRTHVPTHEIVSLSDYRQRHGAYRTDQELQAAHAALPWVVVWDDHETANDSWLNGAENHTEGEEGNWAERRAAAYQAYKEWLPLRSANMTDNGHIYRSLKFGDLVELTIMDLRSYRDKAASFKTDGLGAYQITNAKDRSMLGSEQFAWLTEQIETSTAKWNVMGNSVMISPLNILGLRSDERLQPLANFLSSHETPDLAVNLDQWDGYAYERDRLLRMLDERGGNVLFLTGDIHSEFANSVRFDGREVGVECVCSSISAPNGNETLKMPEDNFLTQAGEEILRKANPHINHIDLDAHGYSIVRIRPEEVELSWYRVDNIEAQNSPVRHFLTKKWAPQAGFIS